MSLMCTLIIKIIFANLIKYEGSDKEYCPEIKRRQHFSMIIISDQKIIFIIEQSEHTESLERWLSVVFRRAN